MKHKIIIITISLIAIILILLGFSFKKLYNQEIKITKVELTEEELTFTLNKDAKCSLNSDKKYINSKNKKCIFKEKITEGKIHIKNKYGKIFEYSFGGLEIPVKGYIESITINNPKIYLAAGSSKKIDYEIKEVGEIEKNITLTSSDENIFTIDENGVINGISDGRGTAIIKVNEIEEEIEVIVTSLIVAAPEEFNYNKSYIPCNSYSAEENDLMDEILKNRVETAGNQTRAGVVAAARFFLLEFPYKLTYFSENGRLSTNGVDGEGRYYHQGMYLNSTRFALLNRSMHGPAVWGCPIYSVPAEHPQNNGLDCSGFVSWVLVQGGYDPGDVGAGVSYGHDLTDLGELKYLPDSFDSLKVGDLLSGEAEDGGHIAIVVGKKDGFVYIGESLWYGGKFLGPVLRKYDKEELLANFYWAVLMDNYYKENGKLTDYWK